MEGQRSGSTTNSRRSTKEVLERHLELREAHDVEADISENYSPQVVLLTCTGIYRGHAGVRQSAQVLSRHFPGGRFDYRTKQVEDEVAFLEWTGRSPVGEVKDGADSFVVRGGKIVAQTIHYTVDRDSEAQSSA